MAFLLLEISFKTKFEIVLKGSMLNGLPFQESFVGNFVFNDYRPSPILGYAFSFSAFTYMQTKEVIVEALPYYY